MRCLFIHIREYLIGLLFAVFVAQPVFAADVKTVFMVLWRGETEVEKGFAEYIAENDLPVEVQWVSVDRDLSLIPDALNQIEAADPDLVYVWGTPITLSIAGRAESAAAAEEYPSAIQDRPIVFTMVSQPIRSGVVNGDGLSGHNVTGISHVVPIETQIQAMQAYMPIDHIAAIYTETEINSRLAVEELKRVGEGQGIRVDLLSVPLDEDGAPDPSTLDALVAEAAIGGPQFLYLGPDSFLGQYALEISDAANALGQPTFASTERSLASSNALYGLVAPYHEVGRLTARKVEQILFEDSDPSTMPFETLPGFSYRIRLDVAKQIGVLPALQLVEYADLIDGI